MKTLAPATAAPRTVMTVSKCSTLSTSSSHTVSMIATASTEPQMKATFLAITVASGLNIGAYCYLKPSRTATEAF